MNKEPKSIAYALGYCESTLKLVLDDINRGVLVYQDGSKLPFTSIASIQESIDMADNVDYNR